MVFDSFIAFNVRDSEVSDWFNRRYANLVYQGRSIYWHYLKITEEVDLDEIILRFA